MQTLADYEVRRLIELAEWAVDRLGVDRPEAYADDRAMIARLDARLVPAATGREDQR